MFNFSYLFSVLFLAFLIILYILVYSASIIYLKFLVILVYVSGVVIFILYISCMCWNTGGSFSLGFLFLSVLIFNLYDYGVFRKFSDVGEFMWIYLFFRFFFNILVIGYSMNLFKVSGSLRF
jgi:hypothetical protein